MASATTKFALPYPVDSDTADGPTAFANLANRLETLLAARVVPAQTSPVIVSEQTATNPVLQNRLLTGHANPAMAIRGDGRLDWGSGGAAAVDTNLYRGGVDLLKTDDALDAVGAVRARATGTAAQEAGLGAYGPGGEAGLELGVDAVLYRAGANVLRTPDALTVDGPLIGAGTLNVAGLLTATGGIVASSVSIGGQSALHAASSAGGDVTGPLSNLQVAAGVIGTTEIADDAITAAKIAADAVGSAEIASDAVGAAEIAADAVGSSEIAAGAVGPSELATDAVTAPAIAAGAVGTAELGANAVTAPAIADGAVGNTELADGAVADAEVAAAANIAGSKLADASVPAAKLSDPELTSIAGLTSAADRVPYYSGAGSAALATLTAYARSLLDDPDAATARATLGLGALATLSAVGTSQIADGSVTAPKLAANAAVPTGGLVPFAGATAPAGWLVCDGAAVSRASYPDLFAVIGTTYGTGDGSSTFNLPDLRGRAIYGVSPGGNSTVDARGDNEGVAAASRTPFHVHGNGSLAVASHSHGPGTLKTGWENMASITGVDGPYNGAAFAWQSQHFFAVDNHDHNVTSGATAAASPTVNGATDLGSTPYLAMSYLIKT